MRKRWIGLVWMCLLAVGLTLVPAYAEDSQAVSDATNGVVQVYTETVRSDGSVYSGVGSAFGVGRVGQETDIFVTNRHVVTVDNQDGSLTQAQRVYLLTDGDSLTITQRAVELDGELYTAEDLPTLYDANVNRMVECDVLYVSEDYDFAVLRALEPVEGRVALELAQGAETMSVSQQVYALGYPAVSDDVSTSTGWVFSGNYYSVEGVDLPIYTHTQGYNGRVEDVTVTTGAISRFTSMASEGDVQVIQHDAVIHGGNSGGPLVNGNGQVVGINTYSAVATESISYAVYIDYVKDVLDELDIPYNEGQSQFPILLVAIIVLVILAVVAVIVMVKKGSGTKKIDPIEPTKPGGEVIPPQPVMANDSGYRVQGETGTFAGRRYAVNGVVCMGRDTQANQVVYPPSAKGISRVHCQVWVKDGQLYLKDVGSSYGTFLGNGQRLAANQAVVLKHGDSFWLGSPNERFVIIQKGVI